MTIPVLSLLGFALWTLLILFVTVGPYRWSRVLTGRASLSQWSADPGTSTGWYARAMRAHMNCIENLPVFGAIVFAVQQAHLSSPLVDGLALSVLGARVLQTTVHISLEQTDLVVGFRFSFFLVQLMAMLAMVVALLALAFPAP
ncbi:MAG: MAPEG family protein [Deltaproteobacteria bacterium]|nr:MAPEG family protein [Deltaproteobacteria bacterium]